MKMKYAINGEEQENYSNIKYLAEQIHKADKELMDLGLEFEVVISARIIKDEPEKEEEEYCPPPLQPVG